MTKSCLVLLLSIVFWISDVDFAQAQQSASQKLDMELTDQFMKMQSEAFKDNWEHFDSLIHAFKKRLKKELATGIGLDCRFDSLSTQMWIVQSDDKRLRIFSWDELSGGTWHDMTAFAQYITSTGAIGSKQLDTDKEMELGGYSDVVIQKIHTVKMSDKTFYLTIGYGTHGAGHHHQTAQIFSIEDKKLVKCSNCFESGVDLVVVSGRSFYPGIKYNSSKKEISYNEFKEDEGGWMMPTGKVIRLKLKGNTFKK